MQLPSFLGKTLNCFRSPAKSVTSPKNSLRRGRSTRFETLEPRTLLTIGPLISEFLAVNDNGLSDGDGNNSDWIEIHNPTSSPISLDLWYLTDDRDDLTQWPLPDVSLDGGEYLVVFASGQEADDYVDAGGKFHTNFRLNGSGEDLLLVEPDGVTYDATFLDFPPQTADISYGISIDGVSETLVASNAPLSYRVPTAGENVTAWTAVNFDDSGFTGQQNVAGSGLLVTEIDTGDATKFIEIQNLSSEVIDASGWAVVMNDPTEGVSGVADTSWSLPASVDPAEILYRTDNAADQYWGSAIPWQIDGPGWTMIVDDAGEVQDFVAWGYNNAEINSINITVGPHTGITTAGHWSGDGADVGAAGGAVAETFTIGPGSNLVGSASVDSAGIRLNIEPTFVQTLSAGTYNVEDISFAARQNGAGQLRAFLAVLTGAGPTYETIWASEATTPAAGDTIHTVSYAAGSQQFTLTSDTEVYAGTWHDGNAIVRFSNLATITNHDNSPIEPSAAGQTIGGFSHGGLNNRTYAYHITVNTGLVATTSLQRIGNVDHNGSSDFERSATATLGSQNSDSLPLFGGIVPTIAGIGFSGGDPQLQDLIQTDVAQAMRGNSASLWTRFEFTSSDMTAFDQLTLRVRYDDGFAAYLDGVPLVARNAPVTLSVDSTATAQQINAQAIKFEDIDISGALGQLTAGDHVLAFHLLNASAVDDDLLLQPELLASAEGVGQFFADATPGQASTDAGFNRVADTKFSVDRGFYDTPQNVVITTETVGATIVYTLDGSEPQMNATGQILVGTRYTAALPISRTTTLRVRAYRQGLLPTNVDTQTYLFVDDIVEQTRQSTLDASFPSSWGGRSADYGLDPDVIGPNDNFGGVYAATIRDDLKALPTMSLVLDIDDMFGSSGIYSNIGGRGVAWERAVSVELIYPDGQNGFQVDAGIRAHGGASRSLSRKNSLRLLFKEQYGPTKLKFPLFGEGVGRFDTVVLRAHFNDGWGWSGAGGDPLFSRDMWHRATQEAMGQTASRGMGVHLYINGIYWGIYNPSERPDASFAAQHLGGDKTEWDSINHGGVVDGSSSAWNTMRLMASAVGSASGDVAKWAAYQAIQGNDSDGNNDPQRQDYLDIENYIDYMLLSFYSGNHDWSTNNWFAARRRGLESEGFQFFAWDSEISMTLSSRTNLNENRTGVNGGVAEPYARLRNYDQFRLAFADRIHKHFSSDGVFYVDPNNPAWDPDRPERNPSAARFAAIASKVSDAVVAESARWGDQHRSTPYTRNAEWQNSLDYMMSVYFPQRTSIVMAQLRSIGFYPNTEAPIYNIAGQPQRGGGVTVGGQLTITNPNGTGTIYYTTDGTDPRHYNPATGATVSGSAVTYSDGSPISITSTTTVKSRVRSNTGEWSALNESTYSIILSDLRITEVNFNPSDPTAEELAIDPTIVDNNDFEFIEFKNIGTTPINLADAQLTDGVAFDFSTAAVSLLAPGEYLVVVRNSVAFGARYDSVGNGIQVAGEFSGALRNSGERVALIDGTGEPLVQFDYNDSWFDHTDGGGFTLTVLDEQDLFADLNQKVNWRPSNLSGGSPGEGDFGVAPEAILINEVLANSTGQADGDWIELVNTTAQPIDMGGWWLSDSADELAKYQFASGTVILANGFLVVSQANHFGSSSADPGAMIGFDLSEHGATMFLTAGDALGNLLGYRESQSFDASNSGESLGLYTKSTGGTDFVRLAAATPGGDNAGPVVGPLVINEIMYHPTDGGVEFIELHNPSAANVPLDDGQGNSWRIRGAIDYSFPTGQLIAAGSYAVVIQGADDGDAIAEAAAFRTANSLPTAVPIFVSTAATSGSLSNGGEKIFLDQPGDPDADLLETPYLLIDAVRYDDNTPWPTVADGTGSSLSRTVPFDYGNDVANWLAGNVGGTPGELNIGIDTTPPTAPTNLNGQVVSDSQTRLIWTAANDPQTGIAFYNVYRNGTLAGSSVLPLFTDDVVFSSSAFGYEVSAVNRDGLEGPRSLVTSISSGTQSISFQNGINGYSGARDTELRQGQPNQNQGTDTNLEVDGDDGGFDLSVLLRWDIAGVPADSVVVGAQIVLNVTNETTNSYQVAQLLKDWDESQATWNQPATGESWQSPGALGAADRGIIAGTVNSTGTGKYTIDFNSQGVALVQDWASSSPGTSNFGFVIGNTTSTNGLDFDSREVAIAGNRPELIIVYFREPELPTPGDVNLDGNVDDADINFVQQAIATGSSDAAFDLNGDSLVNAEDVEHLVENILSTRIGDTDLGGSVNRRDVTTVLVNYGQLGAASWARGDFNGDGRAALHDIARLQTSINASQAPSPMAAAAAVVRQRVTPPVEVSTPRGASPATSVRATSIRKTSSRATGLRSATRQSVSISQELQAHSATRRLSGGVLRVARSAGRLDDSAVDALFAKLPYPVLSKTSS